MTKGFVRWTLRTTDVAAARAFYDALLEEGAPDAVELPAAARARGARPHWLGHLAVVEVEAAVAAFVGRGAVRIGDALRDPSGAVLALTAPMPRARGDIGLEQLLTPDPERAKTDYGALGGMIAGATIEVPPHGRFQEFAWGDDEPCGTVGDIRDKPGIHPQWLFFFRAKDLDSALQRVRVEGGTTLPPTMLPDGRRVAVCEDPQGAQFGLIALPVAVGTAHSSTV